MYLHKRSLFSLYAAVTAYLQVVAKKSFKLTGSSILLLNFILAKLYLSFQD